MKRSLNVVSFFSGCGGMDLGFKQAGFNIALANDCWAPAARSFQKNFSETEMLIKDIKQLKGKYLWELLNKKNVNSIDVVIGGPPCQCFTRLNNNNLRMDDKRNQLFKDYIRLIKALQPKFVIMENVPDLLVRKNSKGQLFKDIIFSAFSRAGYKLSYKIFEAQKYGVPQKRRRVIFFATSDKNLELTFPNESRKDSVVGPFLKRLKKCKRELKDNKVTINGPPVALRIKHVPPGGYYENLPDHLKVKKYREGKLVTVKRYGSYYRRLDDNRPSITITNNYLIHPDEDRYLTNRELAALHTFPNNFEFEGCLEEVSQQIANAVPPELVRRIAVHLKETYFDKT